MDKKNYEIFYKPCSVCGKEIKKDIYDQGKCEYCNWRNNHYADINPDTVLYPNLISLNKAKQLYADGKIFAPNLDEFLEALHCYSEMQFEYKGINYAVELVRNEQNELKICLYNSHTKEVQSFNDGQDFKNKAKINGKLLKDIWQEVENAGWLQ